MNHPLPRLQEEFSAKIPALTLLCNLGWTYLPPETINALRNGKTNLVVLHEALRAILKKRRFTFEGKRHPLSDQAIDTILQEVGQPALNEGLNLANEKMYNHLMYGVPVTEFIGGKKATPTIPLIDWNTPQNNSFTFTEEYRVLANNGVDHRIPDIVCFVNGFPLVVIEAKRPDGHSRKTLTIDAGISQNLRNQRNDEIPQLFAYSQLLLAVNGVEGRYATQGTSKPFWASWREEAFTENHCQQLKNKPVDPQQLQAIFQHRPADHEQWYENLLAQGHLAVTEQDRLLISLLSPDRLLDITRFAVLYDKKIGKIVARYQQYFGVRELIKTINTRKPDGGREGGVIWHTTGSGKSFTMVFLTKALILNDSLKNCRLARMLHKPS
uniref:type I site-specific deoxyribonuclease n=1 Tax=uncultured Thiotrichaceae bacterium TaxID=298394 RepID=A0A6S6SZK5_9GAMM|nr:MAG: Type I restriction-modification system, restriction subunit R (EC [uncultured Thiotrichaceae bacterium]